VKLLQLLTDVGQDYDNSKVAKFSLKSVAGKLYRQHEHVVDSLDNSEPVDCDHNVQETLPTANVIASSTSLDFQQHCQMSALHFSSGQLPFSSTTSVDASSNTVSDVNRVIDSNVSHNPDRRGWNVEHLPGTFFSPASSTSVAHPHFCIPTVPVISPPPRGQRLDDRHVCNTVASQNTTLPYCAYRQTPKTNSSPAATHVIPVVSAVSTPHASMCSWTSLPNMRPSSGLRAAFQSSANTLPLYPHPSSVPSHLTSKSYPVMSTDCVNVSWQSICSEASSRTVISTYEAMRRVLELLTAQCKVLVLMRGLPGCGKSTMARYRSLSVSIDRSVTEFTACLK